MLVYVKFDETQDLEANDLSCVRIGQDKNENGGLENVRYHVLVIRKLGGLSGEGVYERVGVASLRPEHVAAGGPWVDIR